MCLCFIEQSAEYKRQKKLQREGLERGRAKGRATQKKNGYKKAKENLKKARASAKKSGYKGLKKAHKKNGYKNLKIARAMYGGTEKNGPRKGTKNGGFGGTSKNGAKGKSDQIDFAILIPEIILFRKEKDGSSINDVVGSICEWEGLREPEDHERVFKALRNKLSRHKNNPAWVRDGIEIIVGVNVQKFSWNPNGSRSKFTKMKLKIKTHIMKKKASKKKTSKKTKRGKK